MIGRSGASLFFGMVAEPKMGYLLYSPCTCQRGGYEWSFQSFQLLSPITRGDLLTIEHILWGDGVCNHSKPRGWLEDQRLSELEHICA